MAWVPIDPLRNPDSSPDESSLRFSPVLSPLYLSVPSLYVTRESSMVSDRRTLLRCLGAAAVPSLAGCSADGEESPTPTNAAARTERETPDGAATPSGASDRSLIEGLRSGEYTLYLRHAETDGALDPGRAERNRAETQPALTESSRADARTIGRAVRHLGIEAHPVAEALSRSTDTALLAFGDVESRAELTPPLDGGGRDGDGATDGRTRANGATDPDRAGIAGEPVDRGRRADAVAELLGTHLPEGRLRAVVGPAEPAATATGEQLAPCEAAVFDPDGGDPSPVARLTPDDWRSLAEGVGEPATRSWTYRIRRGTPEETPVHVIDGADDGPTGFLVGGMHGDEEGGWIVAGEAADWELDAGRLVVLPRANARAVERTIREYPPGMDLNRQFPRGEPLRTPLARAIWRTVVRHDPDFLLDLHSSRGIWAHGHGLVGQNTFHSRHDPMVEAVTEATAHLNERYVEGEWPDDYEFLLTEMDRMMDLEMLANKAQVELDLPVAIFETTELDTTAETRVEWTRAYTRVVLDEFGIEEFQARESSES